MENNIYVALFGFFGIFITQLFQYAKSVRDAKSIKDVISEQDKSQNRQIAEIKENQKLITSYVQESKYAKTLKNKIRKECNKIISSNSIDNSEFLSLLNNTKKIYAELMNEIINSNVEDTSIDDIKSDLITAAKSLKNQVRWEALNTVEGFCEKLQSEVVIPNINIFLMRLRDEILNDEKKFNGTFSKIAIGVVSTLLIESIKLYREHRR